MWQTYIFAGIAFAVVMAAMAVGVIISNRRIKGSCGGLANFKDSRGNTICDACTNPSPDCTGEPDNPEGVESESRHHQRVV